MAATVSAVESPQRHYATPQQAVTALVAAVGEAGDAGLLAVLGPGARDLIDSGDKVADRNGRSRFLKAYAARHSIEEEKDGRRVLLVGRKDFPFPIPLVRQGDAWRFDTAAGREEILDRRIGRNELRTVAVLRAYTEAQRVYACMQRQGGAPEFAQKFSSSAGKRDGLYWPATGSEPDSPLGPLIAKAAAEGYAGQLGENAPEPFHGYYFRILKGQGAHAKGGAYDYVVDGKMVLGFALIAYPARYGVSGIMTFIVNQEGEIYEKDLGEKTAALAAALQLFDPDPSWTLYRDAAGS